MEILVQDDDKIRMTKFGANKLFDVDYDTRQKMSEEELISLFDKVWLKHQVKALVTKGSVCNPEEAARRLDKRYHSFIDPSQNHRSFRYRQAEFIAQLLPITKGHYNLTQIWRVSSSDYHPKTLFINFSSVEERGKFAELAGELDIKDELLGLRLIRNFMNLHPGYEASEEDENELEF
ncbi:MAG: hypothetical protein ACRCU2_03085 [Planktothrix sp.]